MTPIDGRRHPKGDAWGKKIRLPKQRHGWGCLSVLVPIGPRRTQTADRPVTPSTLAGRPAREAAS